MNLTDLSANPDFLKLTLEDRVKLCMYFYAKDADSVSDALFEAMFDRLPADSPLRFMPWESVGDDDVASILKTLDLQPIEEKGESENESYWKEKYGYLQKKWSRNKSITMIDTVAEAKDITESMLNVYHTESLDDVEDKLLMSLKYDGWNLTLYYVKDDSKPVLIHTRARTGQPIYCTSILRDIMPEIILEEDDEDVVKISGELCLDEDALVILRDYYTGDKREFKNTRNSVSSVVHGTVDVNLIKDHIHFFAFLLQNEHGNIFDRVDKTFDMLQSLGFKVPISALLDDVSQFDQAFNYMTDQYKQLESQIQCDGVVLEPTVFSIQEECQDFIAGDNQKGLIAIKADYWSNKIYVGEVIDIVSPPSEQNRSIVAIIKPVRVSSGSDVERIPLINMRRAHSYGRYVDVGDHILFTYHSRQNIHFEGFEEVLL